MEAQAVKPTFVVCKSGADVVPGEAFEVVCVCVFKPGLDEGAFGFCEERCGGWVIVDEEVGCYCEDYGEESFLY